MLRTHVHRTALTHVVLKCAVHARTVSSVFSSTLETWHTLSLPAICYLLYSFLPMFWCYWCNIVYNFDHFSFLNCYKINKLIKDLGIFFKLLLIRSSPQWCSFKKLFWRNIANLKESTHVEVWFQQLKSFVILFCEFAAYFQNTFS